VRPGREPGRRLQHLDAFTAVINQDELVAVLAAADREQAGGAGPQVAVEESVTAPDRFEDARGGLAPVRIGMRCA
jgi:hypothetical protein